MERIRLDLGFPNCFSVGSSGRRGGLAVLWTEDVQIQLLSYSQSHIDMEIRDMTDFSWHLTGFYGHPETGRRHESWALLKSLKSSSTLPWVCLGDFNEIMRQSEKVGGNPRSERQIHSFCNAIEYCELSELGFKGPRFTFIRKQLGSVLRERLDRVLVTHAWEEQFPGSISHHLPTVRSDHSPILLKVQRQKQRFGRKRGRQFRFENYWLNEEECETIVRDAWNQGAGASQMDIVLDKITKCGVMLQDWSAHKFGNIPECIKMLQTELQQLHDGTACDCSSEHLEQVQTELCSLQQQEEIYWKQRSRVQWLQEGDKNTSFFHTRASERRKKNVITELLDEGGHLVHDHEGMEQIALHYF
ncbi:hypothetical protein SLA2020_198580 [Shorea laevis]